MKIRERILSFLEFFHISVCAIGFLLSELLGLFALYNDNGLVLVLGWILGLLFITSGTFVLAIRNLCEKRKGCEENR